MRSFFSRCSLIIPLVCALMVASQGQFTITNVATDTAIVSGVNGESVETGDNPVTLTIHPAPGSGTTISTIYDKKNHLYVGADDLVPGSNLTWGTGPYKWHVAKTSHGPYVIYPTGPDLFWCQNSTITPYIEFVSGADVRGHEGFWRIHAPRP